MNAKWTLNTGNKYVQDILEIINWKIHNLMKFWIHISCILVVFSGPLTSTVSVIIEISFIIQFVVNCVVFNYFRFISKWCLTSVVDSTTPGHQKKEQHTDSVNATHVRSDSCMEWTVTLHRVQTLFMRRVPQPVCDNSGMGTYHLMETVD